MKLYEETVWVIVTKDRQYIAKGVPRNRSIIRIDSGDKQRVLTYTSKGKAEAAFRDSGFYGPYADEDLEAIEVTMVLEYK